MKRQQRVLKFFLRVTSLLPLAVAAQTAQLPKVEGTGAKTHIESNVVNLKTAADAKMDASLRATDSVLLLTLAGSGVGTATVDVNDEAIFILDNDSTVKAKSIGFQGIESKDFVNTYKHAYVVSREALETLSRHNLRRVRKYAMTEYKDIYLDEPSAGNLRTLCASFLQALNKLRPPKPKMPSAMPAFPGGKDVFLAFLNRNLKLQSSSGESRKVASVQFLVSADGSVSNIQIRQSAGAPYDDELLRILKRMPKWKPAIEDGKQVQAVVVQQIVFYPQGGAIRIQF